MKNYLLVEFHIVISCAVPVQCSASQTGFISYLDSLWGSCDLDSAVVWLTAGVYLEGSKCRRRGCVRHLGLTGRRAHFAVQRVPSVCLPFATLLHTHSHAAHLASSTYFPSHRSTHTCTDGQSGFFSAASHSCSVSELGEQRGQGFLEVGVASGGSHLVCLSPDSLVLPSSPYPLW